MERQEVVRYKPVFNVGALIGAALAGYCSYSLGNNVLWIALHAFFGWWYLLYLCLGCGGGFPTEVLQPPAL